MRLSNRSFAGTARTLVAVGMVSDASMFFAMTAAAPRSGLACSPSLSGPVFFSSAFGFGSACWAGLGCGGLVSLFAVSVFAVSVFAAGRFAAGGLAGVAAAGFAAAGFAAAGLAGAAAWEAGWPLWAVVSVPDRPVDVGFATVSVWA